MQELEKILEEMREIKDGNRKEKLYAKYPPNSKDQKVLNAYSQGYEDGTDNFYNAVVDIIRKYMTNDPAGKAPKVENILDKIEAEHPYKVPGNHNTYSQYNEGWQDAIDRVRGKLENLAGGWIPVERRLPQVFGKYWATIRYSDGRISEPVVVGFRGTRKKYVVDTPNGREYETWGIDSAFYGSRVIAWMPYYVPESYQPERSDCDGK